MHVPSLLELKYYILFTDLVFYSLKIFSLLSGFNLFKVLNNP